LKLPFKLLLVPKRINFSLVSG